MSVDNLVGQTLGQYELRELLGAGGMGAVYRAFQHNLKREVAVKVLPSGLAEQAGYIERFNREAEIAASLEHPNIVPVYDFGTQRAISYVVMRLLTGGSLAQRLTPTEPHAAPRRPSLGEAAGFLKQLASALDYAHSRSVVHRDIKPGNVMFDNHGTAYVVDFGIAKLLDSASNLTGTGMMVGTPSYMAPELWRGDPASPSSDQYALAALLYGVIVGRLPFEAETPYALMHKHMNEAPTPLQVLRVDVPASVSTVLERALAKEPGQRFPTTTAFAQAFENAIEGSKGQATGLFTSPIPARSRPAGARATPAPTPTPAGRTPTPTSAPAGQRTFVTTPLPLTPPPAPPPMAAAPTGGGLSPVLLILIGVIVLLVIALVVLLVNPFESADITPTALAAVASDTAVNSAAQAATDEPTAEPTTVQPAATAVIPTAVPDTPTDAPTSTDALTLTDAPAVAVVPTQTDVPTRTALPTQTDAPTDTDTPAPSATPASTDTPEPTETDAVTATDAPIIVVLPTDTDTPLPSATDAPTETNAPTATDAPVIVIVPTDTNTPVPTDTPEPTDTTTPEPTDTDTPEPTETPSATPSPTPSPSATDTDTPVPTETASPTATPTHTPSATVTPSATPTPSATDIPSATPTPAATIAPTPTRLPDAPGLYSPNGDVRVLAEPIAETAILGNLVVNDVVPLLATNADESYVLVQFENQLGWVRSDDAVVYLGTLTDLPKVAEDPPRIEPEAEGVTVYSLNDVDSAPLGDAVDIPLLITGLLEEDDRFYQVSFYGTRGWVARTFAAVAGDVASIPTLRLGDPVLVVGDSGVALRSIPQPGITTIAQSVFNVELPITGITDNNGYYRVEYEGEVYYVNVGAPGTDVDGALELAEVIPAASPTPSTTATATLFPITAASATNINVRAGDGTNFGVIETLRPGTAARVLGRSSRGNGWLLIELTNGTRGWVSGSVVTVTNDVTRLPEVDPPASASGAAPQPTAVPQQQQQQQQQQQAQPSWTPGSASQPSATPGSVSQPTVAPQAAPPSDTPAPAAGGNEATLGVDCSGFRATSPLGSIRVGSSEQFYWDPAPGATSYRVIVTNQSGEARMILEATSTTLGANTTRWAGDTFFNWQVQALVNGQFACATATVSVPASN